MLVPKLTIRPTQQDPPTHLACFYIGGGTIPKDLNAISNALKDALDWMRSRFGVRRVFVFSDRARQKFSCATLLMWLSSSRHFLQVPIMWLYAPPGHGKGVCDGLGGAIKRMIYHYMAAQHKHVSVAEIVQHLCQHTKNRPVRGTNYCKISEYRFVHVQPDAKPIIKALTIPGTTQFFQWKPVSKGKLMCRRFACFCARCIHNAPGACRNRPFCGDW